jgi:hypothetical protein
MVKIDATSGSVLGSGEAVGINGHVNYAFDMVTDLNFIVFLLVDTTTQETYIVQWGYNHFGFNFPALDQFYNWSHKTSLKWSSMTLVGNTIVGVSSTDGGTETRDLTTGALINTQTFATNTGAHKWGYAAWVRIYNGQAWFTRSQGQYPNNNPGGLAPWLSHYDPTALPSAVVTDFNTGLDPNVDLYRLEVDAVSVWATSAYLGKAKVVRISPNPGHESIMANIDDPHTSTDNTWYEECAIDANGTLWALTKTNNVGDMSLRNGMTAYSTGRGTEAWIQRYNPIQGSGHGLFLEPLHMDVYPRETVPPPSPFQLTSASPLADNVIKVGFSTKPIATGLDDLGDALDARNYGVTASGVDGSGAPARAVNVIAVALDPDPSGQFVQVTLDRPMSTYPAVYNVAAFDLLDVNDNAINIFLNSASCSGAGRVIVPATPEIILPNRDIANPQTLAAATQAGTDPTKLGTYQVNPSGDYAHDYGLESLKKRIFRRLTTRKGAFTHAPTYGVGLPDQVKQLASSSVRQRLCNDAQQQILLEPEVQKVSVRIDEQNATLGVFRFVILVQTSTGLSARFDVPVVSGVDLSQV